jgi:parallel beta-helix repeat protein
MADLVAKEMCAMPFPSWLKRSRHQSSRSSAKRQSVRLRAELLESRELLSGFAPPAVPDLLLVRPGDPHAFQTIQAAVDVAHPGDKIEILGGTYKEAVSVSTPGLTLFGAPGAVVKIQNPGGAMNGFTVGSLDGSPLAGFTLTNVTVSGFDCDGVSLTGVTNFVLSHITAVNNGEYGLFPVLSANGVIQYSSASGSNDTGIYVGQSTNILVQGNSASNNTNGIEIENSTSVKAIFNTVHNNTVGILVDLVPGFPLAFEVSSHNLVANNLVFNNNRANSAPPGDIAAVEPPGTGIAIVGGDHNTVQGNLVFGNAFAGIAVLSGKDLLALAPGTPSYPAGVDPNPDDTLIQNNVVLGNGFVTSVPLGFPQQADLVWTHSGTNNHWKNNIFQTSTPGQLP